MKKVLAFQMTPEEKISLKKICSDMGLGMTEIPSEAVMEEIGSLAKADFQEENPEQGQMQNEKKLSESVLIFCNLTDRQLDKMLEKLRETHIRPDYKAVMTETNQNWTLYHLCAEMQREKSSFEARIKKDNQL